MKKNLIFFVLIAGLAGWAFVLFQKTQTQDQVIAKLRQDSEELPALRTSNAELKGYRDQAAEVEQARKDQRELIKLRNEVPTLRAERKKLDTQLKQLTSMIAVMKATDAHLVSTPQAPVAGQTAPTDPNEMRNTCINNLRLIDGAKQQWALEFKKTADDAPTPDDLLPYLGRNKQWSVFCPAGGTYTLDAVKNAPKCSFPGHVLP